MQVTSRQMGDSVRCDVIITRRFSVPPLGSDLSQAVACMQVINMRMAAPSAARLLLSLSVLLALASAQHAAAAAATRGRRAGSRRALQAWHHKRTLLSEEQLPLDDSYLDRALIADSDGIDLMRVRATDKGVDE